MDWKYLLLSNEGRINRKSYLDGLLPVAALAGLLYLYLKFFTGILPTGADWLISGQIVIVALYLLSNISIKRMHDYGRSAVYLLHFYAPLIVAAIFLVQQKFFPLKSHEGSIVIYTMAVTLAVITFFWMVLEMFFRRSDEDANDYGPPPGDTKTDETIKQQEN